MAASGGARRAHACSCGGHELRLGEGRVGHGGPVELVGGRRGGESMATVALGEEQRSSKLMGTESDLEARGAVVVR